MWRVALVFFLSTSLHNYVWSQPGQDQDDQSGANGSATDDLGDGPCGPDPCQDPDLPIDTNILVLVAAGVGYGLKKTYDLRQTLKSKQVTITTDN